MPIACSVGGAGPRQRDDGARIQQTGRRQVWLRFGAVGDVETHIPPYLAAG